MGSGPSGWEPDDRPHPWFDRTWVFTLPIGAFPAVLERLRGTPVRAEELITGVPDAMLRIRPNQTWSVKEHLAHLDDLHDLDERRLEDFLARSPALSTADLTNRRTHEANHNETSAEVIVGRLGRRRLELVHRMESLTEAEVAAVATHPRLDQPMRLIDWACFVAEHDDHHLAIARQALRSAAVAPNSGR